MNLPAGEHVKIVPDGDRFKIVTVRLGFVVGPRLDRGRGKYPVGPVCDLTFKQAEKAFATWEAFCAAQYEGAETQEHKKRQARNVLQSGDECLL